jgi:hypothetical protein
MWTPIRFIDPSNIAIFVAKHATDKFDLCFFSFDVRGRPFTKALYWSDSNAFGPRAYFVTGSKPAGLTLESVQLDDEGIYRCRVDFKNSPTRNFQINLTVIGE